MITLADSRGARIFLASFLVLFLEVALIRWMPAYIRLLAYFSEFHLAGQLPRHRRGLSARAIAEASLHLVSSHSGGRDRDGVLFRLEVAVSTTGSIYFSSGTAEQVVVVESTMLLPLIFVIVAALFATLAQRMGKEMSTLPPLIGYTLNLLGSLAGVGVFALISWLQLSPTWWFAIGFAAAIPLILIPEPGSAASAPRRLGLATNIALLAAALCCVHLLARGSLWSPYL